MSCQETREKLSALADSELAGDELQRVRGHLAGCSSCRREMQEQGALDMLLKSCFVKEPPATTLEGIWPTIEDRLDAGEGKANGGGTPREGEIVFKSSSAMQMLRIPEAPAPVAATAAPSAAPPARSGWVWPTAMVVSAAILAGGFVLYKRMTPPPAQEVMAQAPAAPDPGDPGAQVAAPSSQPSEPAASEPTPDPGPELTASGERKVAVAAAPRAKRGSKALKVAAAPKGAAPEAKAAEAKPEAGAEAAAKPARKKGDDLDNLIDDAIGGSGQPIPKKKKDEAAPKAPAEDLPEQLTMNQIRTAMNKVKGQVQACYDKYQIEGEARVTFTINSDGGVGDCGIKGKFFGTDTGTCVVAAVKKARFPKFSGKAMAINNYPFLLQ